MLLSEKHYFQVRNLVFPATQLKLSFPEPQLDVLAVEKWLNQFFPQSISDCTELAVMSDHANVLPGSVWRFARCISALSVWLFRHMNCPVFDVPEVLTIERKAEPEVRFEVIFGIKNTGFEYLRVLQQALAGALQACLWLGQQGAQAQTSRRDVQMYIEHQVLGKLTVKSDTLATTMKLLEVACRHDIPYSHLGQGIYRLGWGKSAKLFLASMDQADCYSGVVLAGNKLYTTQLLRAAGLAAPVNREVTDQVAAVNAAKKLGFPVVVKPVDSDRGNGVTVDLYDEDSVQQAFRLAQGFTKSKRVLVEKQAVGVCHRLFMVDGRLLYAVKRWPPSVFGDGFSTVKMLVEANCQQELQKLPGDRKPLIFWDLETENFIKQLGLTGDYIPALAERVSLRRIESTQWGGFDEEVTHHIHPDTLRQAVIACRLVNLTVVGVDVITDNISLPLSQTGGVINELNAGPLLGGGDISRSYIPEYLERLLPLKGRIGIDIFPTAQHTQAKAKFTQQCQQGTQCYFTTDQITFDDQGNEIFNSDLTLAERLRQLIFNPAVESICIVTDYWGSTQTETKRILSPTCM
jgi:cyanophycin synthetase